MTGAVNRIGVRLLGLVLAPLCPLLALWAVWVFRKSDHPYDRSYCFNLKALLRECARAVRKGEFV